MPVLNICAHQDDDLYFMSPDIIGDMNAAGTTVAAGSLFISAGDAGAGWGSYAQGRETGAKAAWAQMAGVSSPTWTNSTITLAGKTVSTSTLNGTSVRLIFLRIADGGYGGGGDPHYLAGLYDGTRSSLTALDSSNTYTKSEMTAVLTAAIGLYGATLVRHHNHLDDWGSEHYDHTACGRFAADAVAACTVPPAHVGYLGYRSNSATLWDNVSSANQTAKRAAFAAYAAYDTAISGTSWDNAWIPRQYKAGPFPTGTASGTTRRIFTSSDDSALGVNADTTATIVGMPFSVNADSLLTAITMMIPSGQNAAVTGTQVTAHLWTQTGTAGNYPDTYLGSAPAAYLTRGTRNVFTLTKPIRLTSGQRYWATMRFPAGYYPRTEGKFSSAGATSTDGRISTPANSTIANNQYSYDYLPYFGVGASPTNGNYGASWYGLDVVVADLAASGSGNSTATSAATGAVSARMVAAGVAAGLALTSAVVGLVQPTTAAALSSSAASGNVGVIQGASGAAPLASTASAAVSARLAGSGVSTGTSLAAGAVASRQVGSAGAGAVSTSSGSAEYASAIGGTVPAASASAGTVTLLTPAAGSSAGLSAVAADVRTRLAVAGMAPAVSTATGSVEPGGSASGTAVAVSATSGGVTARMAAACASQTASSATGLVASRLATSGIAATTSAGVGTVLIAGGDDGTPVKNARLTLTTQPGRLTLTTQPGRMEIT